MHEVGKVETNAERVLYVTCLAHSAQSPLHHQHDTINSYRSNSNILSDFAMPISEHGAFLFKRALPKVHIGIKRYGY